MKWVFLCCLGLSIASSALAVEEESGFLKINGEAVYFRHLPAQSDAPTFVLLNGLTYSTLQWAELSAAFRELYPEAGILQYDMKGMGKTMFEAPLPVNYPIGYQDQVEQLKSLLEKRKVQRANLVGLSYGGGIAIAFAHSYPKRAEALFLAAPFTEALAEQDRLIRTQVNLNRLLFPFNPATDDELYDYYLRQFIYQNYPLSEPSVLENPYKLEAIYRMVQGIRLFRAETFVSTLSTPVHLMVANQDQYIPKEVLNRFWNALPAEVQSTRIDISYTEHKMPEAIPKFLAAWITTVVRQKLRGVCEGEASHFRATCGRREIRLPRF